MNSAVARAVPKLLRAPNVAGVVVRKLHGKTPTTASDVAKQLSKRSIVIEAQAKSAETKLPAAAQNSNTGDGTDHRRRIHERSVDQSHVRLLHA
ncbi:hypothetical protein MRX96_057376 [Rhipicephalus microplus]